jgi:thiol-disulfide isomerase/thioredoxin|tara:strand:+ start:6860 stop:7219 length:360 start_codon:yes stop_codon:yes gene_type:complete
MQVERLSEEALEKILSGKTQDATSVIKFYSNGCDFCHALSDYYKDIADKYKDIHFFAFNVDDSPGMAEKIGINGVPSISLIKTRDNRRKKIKILSDPENPHKKTWYTSKHITDFIDKEK